MQPDDLIRIRHMLKAGRKAILFVQDRQRPDLDQDDMPAFALMKAIENMGEAANKVSSTTKTQFHEIPWARIVGMRNRLMHAYDNINLDILWQTETANLPPLIAALEDIVASRPCE
jgi:uncharacterized protein with HEPN domain